LPPVSVDSWRGLLSEDVTIVTMYNSGSGEEKIQFTARCVRELLCRILNPHFELNTHILKRASGSKDWRNASKGMVGSNHRINFRFF
jgi:hypothetical protein